MLRKAEETKEITEVQLVKQRKWFKMPKIFTFVGWKHCMNRPYLRDMFLVPEWSLPSCHTAGSCLHLGNKPFGAGKKSPETQAVFPESPTVHRT